MMCLIYGITTDVIYVCCGIFTGDGRGWRGGRRFYFDAANLAVAAA